MMEIAFMSDDDKTILLRLSRSEVKDLIAILRIAVTGPGRARLSKLGHMLEGILDDEPDNERQAP